MPRLRRSPSVLIETLAADIRRLRSESAIEQCLGPMLDVLGGPKKLADFWMSRYEAATIRRNLNPDDVAAETFITNTLFSILSMSQAEERRHERVLKAIAQLERAVGKINNG